MICCDNNSLASCCEKNFQTRQLKRVGNLAKDERIGLDTRIEKADLERP